MTVERAIQQLNDQHCHKMGVHVCQHPMEYLPRELASSNTPYNLMRQTYDWRCDLPKKDTYTVTLTAEDVRFLANAVEIYDRVMSDLHIAPHLGAFMKMMDGNGNADEE